MWNKIQRIYVESNQVRPPSYYEYSYDFRNKSTTSLTNDWWSFPKWTDGVAFDSNGMYKSSSWWRCGIYPIDVNGATKITVQANRYNIQTDVDMNAWIWQWINSNGNVINANQIYRGYNLTNLYVAGTQKYNWGSVTWSYSTSMVLDIANTTATFNVWSSINQTYTLSASDITSILACTYLNCAVCKSGNHLKDISITINY